MNPPPPDSLASRIEALFGGLAALVVWSRHETPGPESPDIYPEEANAVERAVPSRRQEFARGRSAAREALSALGLPPCPIPVGPGREPLWPDGVVGSITHCDGLVAAVVAHESRLAAVGIDAEPAVALPAETRSLVLRRSERSPDPVIETIVFSAKESIYKALFPLVGVWIGFQEVQISVDSEAGAFTASSSSPDDRVRALVPSLTGRFLRRPDFVVTACRLEAPGGS